MIVSLIVAYAKNTRAIGKDNQLLWHLKDDLKKFKEVTLNHTLIMGRKTFDSIGRPLPKRHTIIVTRNTDYAQAGCSVVHSIEQGIQLAKKNGETEVFIAGGAEIYKQSLPFVDQLYLTEVDCDLDGDVYFPQVDLSGWKNINQYSYLKDERNQYPFSINIWEKLT